jgi:ElaB/YqjD/DUF883 family membrane-anchored ribosome-binding protein
MNAPVTTPPLEQAQRRVEGVIRSTQQAAHHAVDHLADGAEHLAANADRLAHRSADALHGGMDQLREHARHATDSTIVHIRQEPLKAVMIAGVLGVTLGALLTLLGRTRH